MLITDCFEASYNHNKLNCRILNCKQSLYIMSIFRHKIFLTDFLCKKYFYDISKFLLKDMAVFTVLEESEIMTTK